jgi:hypothetical protein
MVEALLADRADESFGERVRTRRTDRSADGLDTDRGEDLVEALVNLVSRSRTRNRNRWPASSRSEAKLRATGVTHGPFGLAVTPNTCTTRLWISMTNSTE